MKKILSLVLVLSMVFGSFGFAFAAPADVEGTDYEDAVTRLMALEVVSGFPNGDYKPEETVTRAQFAKIMANALGVGTAAQYAHGATKFADVSADHWAAGYINVVSDLKIVNGYGDGNFGPEDQVTYAEAITMIVRSLGYEPKAKAIGGYPGGYIAIGAEKEITDDVNVINTLAANRGDVALMVDASLDVAMMVQKTWGQYPEYEEDEDKTLLTTKLDVDEVSGTVVAIPNTESSLDDNEIKIKDEDGNTDTYELLVDANYDTLLGLEVTVWADGSDVFFVDIDTDSDDIYFDTTDSKTDEKQADLYVEGDQYDWAKDAKVYVNFSEEKDLDDVEVGFYGYFVLNDDDEVAYANLFDFDNGATLVTEVDGEEIEFENSSDLDLEDFEDGVYVYDKNFNKADIADVDVNSVFYSWADDDELYVVLVNETVSGKLERVKDDEIKLDGEDYDAASDCFYSADNSDSIEEFKVADDLGDLVGEEVTVVLDANGDAIYVTGDVLTTSDLVFGLLKDIDKSGFAYKAKIFTQDGEEVVYEFEDSADYNVAKGLVENTLVAFKLNKDGEIAEEEFYKFDGSQFLNGAGDDLDDDYANVELQSGSEGFFFDDDDDMIVDTKTDSDERYYVEEDTILFNVESDGDAELVNFEDVEDITSKVTIYSIVKEDKGRDLTVVVFDAIETNTSDAEYAVVTGNPELTSDGWEIELNVFDTGVKTYFFDDDEVAKADLAEGNVISFQLNGDDEIYKVNVKTAKKTVDQVDGKYIDIDTTSATDWEKFDADAVIYLLDEDGDVDKVLDYDEIDENDVVIYLTDDGKIVALAVVTEAAEEETPEGATEGVVTYKNIVANDEGKIEVDDVVYGIDNNTVLRNEEGTIIADGGTDIDGKLTEDVSEVFDVVAVAVEDTSADLITAFKLKTADATDLSVANVTGHVAGKAFDVEIKAIDSVSEAVDTSYTKTVTVALTGGLTLSQDVDFVKGVGTFTVAAADAPDSPATSAAITVAGDSLSTDTFTVTTVAGGVATLTATHAGDVQYVEQNVVIVDIQDAESNDVKDGNYTVKVVSDQDGEVFNGTVAVSNGDVNVPVTLTTVATHNLTVTIDGVSDTATAAITADNTAPAWTSINAATLNSGKITINNTAGAANEIFEKESGVVSVVITIAGTNYEGTVKADGSEVSFTGLPTVAATDNYSISITDTVGNNTNVAGIVQ